MVWMAESGCWGPGADPDSDISLKVINPMILSENLSHFLVCVKNSLKCWPHTPPGGS